ncbi:alpha/beta fold hydrolase [Thalassococcus profundi]|mgnify:FL=1|uniref:Alpha/beta fold hydrolase n=1 Tax=Thalassococcus profundi TaxID=2282382 RepID=A0A369TQK6_9RHOB|nr:alpha/beta fold hydrolase [Thalassococcus profundi]RDD67561.1 alpha/beta fold hydrolase [Thalassococcus profundi]
MKDHDIFDLGPTTLACGVTVPSLHLAYKVYGTLDAETSNLILYPTSYGAQHSDIDWLIGPGRILDPERYCIVIPNQLGNGLSSSPSTLPDPFSFGRAPAFSHLDNVAAQNRLLTEVLGVDRIALIYGWSMGGQQALHWGALHPERVAAICATCTSARTSPHNALFLEGLRAALTADPGWNGAWFTERPIRGLRAFARIYAGWALSQAFYRNALWSEAGFVSREDYLIRAWEGNFLRRDPMDLLSMIDTWIASDISDNDRFRGDLDAALGAIEAPAIIMPSTTDLYFTLDDSRSETARMPNAELRPIRSDWGHRAGNPQHTPEDEAVIAQAVRDLLSA